MAAKNNLDSLQSGRDGRILVEYVDDLAIMRFDCGENRFNRHFLDELNRCLDEILQHSGVRAIVSVGTGKFYSNGLDLNWVKEVSVDVATSFIQYWHKTLRRFLLLPLPTIAAINGHAFAGGAFLSLCHDYRIMRTGQGWWSINEVHLGMQIPKWLISLALLKIPGSKAISDILLFGKRLTGEEALSLGVVHKITSSEALLKEAVKLAKDSYKQTPLLQREMVEMMKNDAFAQILHHHDDQVYKVTSYTKSRL